MKNLFSILGLSLLVLSARGQITAGNPELDQFNYTSGSALTNYTNPNGTKWIECGAPSGSTRYPTVTSGNLTVPGLLPPAGNEIVWGAAVSTQTGSSSSSACAVLPLTGKTQINGNTATNIFYSVAFEVNSGSVISTTALGVFQMGFVSGVTLTGQSGSPGSVGGRLYIKTNTAAQGDFSIGLNKADGTNADTVWEGGNSSPTAYAPNTVHFIVVEYSFSGAENQSDTASMWVDPSPTTFGAPTPPISDPSYVTTLNIPGANSIYGGNDINTSPNDTINGFEFRQSSAGITSMTADELSIGSTWADVTPIPPAAPGSFSGLASASSPYDTTFTLTGTVSGAGPTYPAIGENVSVTINGVTETTTITTGTGGFTINYKNCNAPYGGGPYTITYNYNGPTLGACSDSSTTLTVTGPATAVFYGTRMTDGTATAAPGTLYVSNAAPGDVLTIGGTSATLAGSVAGLQAITSLSGLTLGGTSASNYTLSGSTGAVTLVTPPLLAGQPIFDPFASATGSGGTAYAPAANLVGQTNAQGLGWVAMGTSSSQPTIQTGTLSTPGLLADDGNSVLFGGVANGTSARVDFGTSTANTAFYGGSSYTIYYSMLFQVNNATGLSATSPGFVTAFSQTSGTSSSAPTSGFARLYLLADGAGFDMGINKSDGVGADIAWEGGNIVHTVYGTGTTYFIVAAYTFSGTAGETNDSVSLWVNPSPSTFGSATAPTPDATTAAGAQVGTTSPTDELSSFFFRNSNVLEPQAMTADELSIGLSWADVTPAYYSITSIVNKGTAVEITWQSTAGATYQVIGSTNLKTSYNAWGNVGSSVTATGSTASNSIPISGTATYFMVKRQLQ